MECEAKEPDCSLDWWLGSCDSMNSGKAGLELSLEPCKLNWTLLVIDII